MRIKINPIPLILFCELLIATPYACITHLFPGPYSYVKYLRVLCILLESGFLFLTLLQKDGGRITWKILLQKLTGIAVICYAFVYFIITLKNSGGLAWTVNQFTPFVLIVLAVYRSTRQSMKGTLLGIASFFWIAICLNFLTIILYGDQGLYIEYTDANYHNCYLLGVDNQFGKFIFPGLALIWFYEEYAEQRPLLTYSSLALALLTYLFLLNGTGCVVIVMYIGLFVLYKTKKVDWILSFPLFAGVILFLVLNIFFQAGILYGDSAIMRIITEATGKTPDFSGRTPIWAAAMEKFWQNPLLGYGKQQSDYMVELAEKGNLKFSCHNVFLQTLLEGGFVGVVFFLLPFVFTAMQSIPAQKENRSLRILYIGFFCTSMYFMFEVGTMIPLFVLLLILSLFSSRLSQRRPLAKAGEQLG